jgi:uncharacterized protein YciI
MPKGKPGDKLAANVRTASSTVTKSCNFLCLKQMNMKKIITSCFLLISIACFAQQNQQKPKEQIKQNWFVMLKNGPNRNHDSATAAKIQEGHIANINRLHNEGKLKFTGPLGDDGNWRGIFIFDASARGVQQKKKWNSC